MYSAGYGFANNAAPSFNNPAPQQPGTQPAGQQIMYNQQQQQQQFAGMTPQGAFAPGANPQMMPGGPGMMPNAGMPHMAANGQMAGYQQQFQGAPYGQVVPSSVGPQSFNPNYMMAGGMQGFQMNQAGMPQQQMMQRMQQQQQQQQQPPQQPNPAAMGQVSTPQRPPSAAQGTPTNALPSQQGQFPTPQPPSQSQTPTNQQQPPQQPPQPQQSQAQQSQQTPATASTPQTPTFSSNQNPVVNGGSAVATPLSPGTESREKERFSLLLDINHELLYESIQLQMTQQELKKEHAGDANTGDKKPTEEETHLQQDYLQCMRRLQANLSYMAALADRKPEVKVPPCPQYLSAPPLHLTLKLKAPALGPDGAENKIDPVADREERDKSIKDLYSRLQAAFPTIDPKKEPVYRMNTQGQKPGNAANQASPTAQRTPQMTNMSAPPMPQGSMP